MYGRYGTDTLNKVSLIVCCVWMVIANIISLFVNSIWFYLFYYVSTTAIIVWMFFRTFSRNIAARRRENERDVLPPLRQLRHGKRA